MASKSVQANSANRKSTLQNLLVPQTGPVIRRPRLIGHKCRFQMCSVHLTLVVPMLVLTTNIAAEFPTCLFRSRSVVQKRVVGCSSLQFSGATTQEAFGIIRRNKWQGPWKYLSLVTSVGPCSSPILCITVHCRRYCEIYRLYEVV